MKKLIFTLTIAIAVTHCLFAQNTNLTEPADTTLKFKNYIFGEIAGSSLGLSVNYERFLSKNAGGFSVRAGVGFGILVGVFSDRTQLFASIPLGISYNFPISKNKRNFFELGGSYTFIRGSDNRHASSVSIFGTDYTSSTGEDLRDVRIVGLITGWRHTSASGKVQLRLYLMPLLKKVGNSENASAPFIGFSIGRRF